MKNIIKNMSKIIISIIILLAFKNSNSTPINTYIDNVNPPMNAVSVNRNSDVTVVFTQPMNAATMNTPNIKVFGYLRGLLDVTVSYEQATKTLTINPNQEMKIGEEISVTLTDNITTMGGQSITPFVYKFRVQVLGGNGMFIRASGISGFQNAYLKSGDIDGDNDIDLVVNNKIYKNEGQAVFSFSNELSMTGIPELADFDSDGDLDILIQNGNNVFFYQNNGLGNFAQTYSFSGGVDNYGDLNGDGFLDLVYFMTVADVGILRNNNGIIEVDTSFHFDGNINYNDRILIDDFNNDGSLDPIAIQGNIVDIVGIYHLRRNYIELKNNGYGNFISNLILTNQTISTQIIYSYYGSQSFDFNNDNYIDIISPDKKYENNHNNTYTGETFFSFSLSLISDFTGQSSIDILSTVDQLPLYSNINNGLGNFNQIIGNTGQFLGGTTADFDNDGDMDIASVDLNLQEVSILINTDIPSPVELSSFNTTVSTNNITLNWTTSSEKNNSGFDVERSESNGWIKLGFVEGNGNSNSQQSYSYTDRNLNTGKYKYRLKQTDFNGNFEYYELSGEVIIGVPVKSGLAQNYPNPFNPKTIINYELGITNYVSLKVYDALGSEVMTLVNENKQAGYYKATFDGSNLPSGMYFYRLSVDGNVVDTKRMALVK